MPNFLKDTKKIVGMDLDDVLANFIKTFMAIAERKFGVDPTVLPDSWEWTGCRLLDGTPLTQKQTLEFVDAVWEEVIATGNFWETLEVMPGVDREKIAELSRKTKLYFPTARAVTAGGIDVGFQSALWIHQNFGIMFPTVFVSMEKGPLAAALKYDYFIDDRPVNCEAIKKANPTCKVYLMNASHNQTYNNPEFTRVYSANEFADIVLREG